MLKIIFLSLFIFSSWAKASSLSADQVVKSSLTHYPQVLNSMYQLEESKSRQREARGEFDGKLTGSVDDRTEGFYDGRSYRGQIEKPFPFLNSKIYTGYRRSNGTYPSYEGKLNTLDGGEQFIGASLSLLKNSLIDLRRYDVKIKTEDVVQQDLNLKQTKLEVQNLALKAYWTWVVKGYELKAYEHILELAQKRASQLNRRIKEGDLAAIYGSENLQYIRKREAQVKQSQLEFQEASYYLSLFHRGSSGEPLEPKATDLPELDTKSLKKVEQFEALYHRALSESLDLKILQSTSRQAEQLIKLGRNELLPSIDVKYELSRDDGLGSPTLAQRESRIGIQIEVPLQFNKGQGKKQAGKMKKDMAETKIRFTKEKLKVYAQSLVLKINTLAEVTAITAEQVELANKLAQAEVKKFKGGASDLILVNLREENLAESQIKNLDALLKYHFHNADLKSLIVEFI